MKPRDKADARAALGLGPAALARPTPATSRTARKRAAGPGKPAAGVGDELHRVAFWLREDLAERLRGASVELRRSQGALIADALTALLDRLAQKHGRPFRQLPPMRSSKEAE